MDSRRHSSTGCLLTYDRFSFHSELFGKQKQNCVATPGKESRSKSKHTTQGTWQAPCVNVFVPCVRCSDRHASIHHVKQPWPKLNHLPNKWTTRRSENGSRLVFRLDSMTTVADNIDQQWPFQGRLINWVGDKRNLHETFSGVHAFPQFVGRLFPTITEWDVSPRATGDKQKSFSTHYVLIFYTQKITSSKAVAGVRFVKPV